MSTGAVADPALRLLSTSLNAGASKEPGLRVGGGRVLTTSRSSRCVDLGRSQGTREEGGRNHGPANGASIEATGKGPRVTFPSN